MAFPLSSTSSSTQPETATDHTQRLLLLSSALNTLGKTFSAGSGNPRAIAVGQQADQTIQQAAMAHLMKKFTQPSALGTSASAPGLLYDGGAAPATTASGTIPAVPSSIGGPAPAPPAETQPSSQVSTALLDPKLMALLPPEQQGMLMNSVLASEKAKTELADTAFRQQLALQENARANQSVQASADERAYQHTQDTQANSRADEQVNLAKQGMHFEGGRLALAEDQVKADEAYRKTQVNLANKKAGYDKYLNTPRGTLDMDTLKIIPGTEPAGKEPKNAADRTSMLGFSKEVNQMLLSDPALFDAAKKGYLSTLPAAQQKTANVISDLQGMLQANPQTGGPINLPTFLQFAELGNPGATQKYFEQGAKAQEMLDSNPDMVLNRAVLNTQNGGSTNADASKISSPGGGNQAQLSPKDKQTIDYLKTPAGKSDPHRLDALAILRSKGVDISGL